MTKILIAQPTTGHVVTGTVGYMMDLARTLSEDGIRWGYKGLAMSNIALSRNVLASHVIADNIYTHLLFIDADMGFDPRTITRMIEFDKPVVAAACPKRYVAWERIQKLAAADATRDRQMPTADLMDLALRYNVYDRSSDGSKWQSKRDGGFITVPAIGTGIMLIHRDVFEIMLAHEVAVPRPGYQDLPLLGAAPLCDFFSPLEAPDGSMFESEDISFCRRWVERCSGEIWANIDSRIMHYGMRGHAGRYLSQALSDFPELAGGGS